MSLTKYFEKGTNVLANAGALTFLAGFSLGIYEARMLPEVDKPASVQRSDEISDYLDDIEIEGTDLLKSSERTLEVLAFAQEYRELQTHQDTITYNAAIQENKDELARRSNFLYGWLIDIGIVAMVPSAFCVAYQLLEKPLSYLRKKKKPQLKVV